MAGAAGISEGGAGPELVVSDPEASRTSWMTVPISEKLQPNLTKFRIFPARDEVSDINTFRHARESGARGRRQGPSTLGSGCLAIRVHLTEITSARNVPLNSQRPLGRSHPDQTPPQRRLKAHEAELLRKDRHQPRLRFD